jgi:DNA polymerase III subunit delta
MTILRAEDFEAFLKQKSAKMNGLLLHGSDAEAVGVLARQSARAVAGQGHETGLSVHLDMAALKENPSKLLDEFQSLSLLGDRQVIVVDGVDDSILKFSEPIINSKSLANFVIMLAGTLGKSSKLRVLCEEAPLFASLVIYEEDHTALAARLRREISEQGLKWFGDAEAFFFERVGFDRSSVAQEIAKLTLYCSGLGQITEEDVVAICGDTASFGTDELIDTVMQGDLEKADRMSSSFDGDQRTILIMLLNHVTKLQTLRCEIDNGSSVDSVVRSAKPPIFFKRQNAIKSQLKSFDMVSLMALQEQVSSAILQTRKLPDIANAITNRTVLSIARSAAARN